MRNSVNPRVETLIQKALTGIEIDLVTLQPDYQSGARRGLIRHLRVRVCGISGQWAIGD
jgi:hypothetical protein